MIPELIASVLREAFIFLAELFRFLCTPAGQDLVKESLKDKAKFETAVDALGLRIAGGWAGFVKLLEAGR